MGHYCFGFSNRYEKKMVVNIFSDEDMIQSYSSSKA